MHLLFSKSFIAVYERNPRRNTLLVGDIMLAKEFNKIFLLFVNSTGEEVEGDVGICGRTNRIA